MRLYLAVCLLQKDNSLLNDKCFKLFLGPYDTDFRDNHLGNVWKNDIYDTPEFDWSVHKGATRTEGTGPSRDHLGRNGKMFNRTKPNRVLATVKNSALHAVFPITLRSQFPNLGQEKIVIRICN